MRAGLVPCCSPHPSQGCSAPEVRLKQSLRPLDTAEVLISLLWQQISSEVCPDPQLCSPSVIWMDPVLHSAPGPWQAPVGQELSSGAGSDELWPLSLQMLSIK